MEKKIDPVIYNKVLELNCGTGTDAIWMASKGFKVLATDISTEMIRLAELKSGNHKQDIVPEFKPISFNGLGELKDKEFDVIFSNFGGLNCVDAGQIQALAMDANKLLRPGGKFIAVIMGRNCLLENVYFKLKNKKLQNRRKSKLPVTAVISDVSFPIWYYAPDEFAGLMKPWFTDPVLKPIGLFIPPSFMNNYFSKLNNAFLRYLIL